MLERLLTHIGQQQTEELFTFSVIVVDNDQNESARRVVEQFQGQLGKRINYSVEPIRNIALVRNRAVKAADGDFIVFIDDDEFPVRSWLVNLYKGAAGRPVAGVLGPVLPHFDKSAPKWVIRGGFYDRPRHATGFEMPWQECRTGNVLIRREILPTNEPCFREEFGKGGEDQDFFWRMTESGHRFVWCDEAIAYEEVPPTRCTRKFLLSRAMLRGKNSLRHQSGRLKKLGKSALAVPVYLLLLPVLIFAGQHYFMRYLVKLADHGGRLLALIGLNPIQERPM
jgi:succinoglycan biosynthesis protein ExoM